MIKKIWDNLFYQVITQESFAIKEAIMQILLANHVIHVLNKNSNTENSLLFATVVLPKSLFNESDGNDTSSILTNNLSAKSSSKNAIVASKDLSKKIKIENAKINIKNLEELKEELKIVQKRYDKEYQKAYQKEYQAHLIKIKPLIEQYNIDYENELKTWCSTRDKTIEKDDPCYNKPIYTPPGEEFNFSYPSMLEASRLKSNLTEKSYAILTSILNVENATNNKILMSLDDYSGISEVNSIIDSHINDSQQIISANTILPKATFLRGIPIPIPTEQPLMHLDFLFNVNVSYLNGVYIVNIIFKVPNANWVLTDATYNYTYNSSDVLTENFNPDNISNLTNDNILINPLFQIPIKSPYAKGKAVSGELTFNNGCKKTFLVNLSSNMVGDRSTFLEGDCDTDINIDDNINFPPAFKPSGFGFRQLGIADYRKVNQETFCYTEGEVAHIENIMAREYKEKSTRRLRVTEDTTTTSSETELEQLTDTTSTSRFEMQTEVAKVLQESRDLSAFANASYTGPGKSFTLNVGGSFASHTSKEESTRQAQTEAQEITNRALDRIVSRVKEERVYKVIEEFEENNKHGFDNRKGDKHVVGVYRWVDKIYKNQIYNYGKRLMFEFMIPQPGKLHALGMQKDLENDGISEFNIPVDPRKASEDLSGQKISNPSDLDESKALFWAGYYNVEIEARPPSQKEISTSFGIDYNDQIKDDNTIQLVTGKGEVEIPEGYLASSASFSYSVQHGGFGGDPKSSITIGGVNYENTTALPTTKHETISLPPVESKLGYSFATAESPIMSGSIAINCNVKIEWTRLWQIKTFNAIISAYEEAKAAYEEKLAKGQEEAKTIKDDNPLFYRDIENMVLRKNCISYLVDRDNDYGKKLYNPDSDFKNTEVELSSDLDNYTAKAKFMEQAFEWNIMSYSLYPYYWGNKDEWRALYQYDNIDPLFKNFMGAGLARVVVTVRPGFEDAVRHFIATGQIWNGGQVPVIEDDLYLSIVDELKEDPGTPEGKAWFNRLPTSLTILQAGNIGLIVKKALPCNCEELKDLTEEQLNNLYENPETVPCGNFESGIEHDDGTTLEGYVNIDNGDWTK